MVDRMESDVPSNLLFWFEGTDIKKMVVEAEEISAKITGVMGDRLLKFIFSPSRKYILNGFSIYI